MRRVLVCGITGAGKSTFASNLASLVGLPYHQMDAMFHGPNWQPIPTFEDDVAGLIAGNEWVVDSHGYAAVRNALWSRADTAIWLDYTRSVVFRRVLARSASRAWTGEPTFNGNTESFRDWLDPEHPVQWAMSQYNSRRQDMITRFAATEYQSIRRVRLRCPAAADLWLRVTVSDTARTGRAIR